MRKNTQQVIAAFVAARPARPSDAIWTDGKHIYSYSTCIAARAVIGGETAYVVLNRTKYSTTTSIQQGGIAYGLQQHFRTVDAPEEYDRNVWPENLLDSYYYHMAH